MATIEPVKPGTLVEWTSQSQGVEKAKQGTVLSFVPAGSEIHTAMRSVGLEPTDLPVSRMLFDMRPSKNDRYLVAVPRGRGADYYGPRASAVTAVAASQNEGTLEERAEMFQSLVADRMSNLSKSGQRALSAAVSALYFADSSDYPSALWSVVTELLCLDPQEIEDINPHALAHALNPDWDPCESPTSVGGE